MARWFVDRLPQRGIPSVSLRRLLPEAQFVGCADWEVSGCCDDHRRLDPGQVFVAVRGARPGYDGHAFVREALERGAAGIVVEHPCPDAGRLQVVVPDATAAHARICQALAGDPSHHLLTAGVTGSFGRTIAALFVRSILEAAGQRDRVARRAGILRRHDRSPAGRRVGCRITGSRCRRGPGVHPGRGADGIVADAPRPAARRVHPRRGRAGGAPVRDGRARLQGGRARGIRRGAGTAIVRGGRLPRRDGDGRRCPVGLSPGSRPPSAPGQGAAVPPGRARRAGGGQRRRSQRRDPGRGQPRCPPDRLRDGAGGPVGTRRRRVGADRAARRRGHANDPARLRSRARGPAPPGRTAGGGAAPWRRRPWRGPWRSTATRSPPVCKWSRQSPGSSRRSTRVRTSTSGSTPPARRTRWRRPSPPPGPSAPGECTASWAPREVATAPARPAGGGRRGPGRPRDPDRQQPPLRGPRPDPRPAPGRIPAAGQGPRRARPPTGHRGRPGRRPQRRLRTDRRQGTPYLPDPGRSRRPLRRRRSRPRMAPPPHPPEDDGPAFGVKKSRNGRPGDSAARRPRTKSTPPASE